MSKSEFNQGVSIKVFIADKDRADKTRTVYLRVTIARKKREFNLKVSWPAAFFDLEKEQAKPRHAKDSEVDSVNMVINEAKGRATRIKLRYFSESRSLTLDLFAKEFENYESRDNFLLYWENKIDDNINQDIISEDTGVRHTTNFKRFKAFLGDESYFPMSELTAALVIKYKKWLTKKKKMVKTEGESTTIAYNTVVNALKGLQRYVNAAVADGFKIEDPFAKIKLNYNDGDREALEKHELKALQAHFEDSKLEHTEREVLRKFLFSCFTGLRVSDNSRVTRAMIRNNHIRVDVKKGRRVGRVVDIPLAEYANKLIEGRKGLLFPEIEDQTCNKWLKIIAHKCNIDKHLTFHVSRDTFATLFIEMGGDVFTLKELLGHGSVRITEKYVKMSENRKQLLMDNFNNL
ncbi:site-specific integrase [Mucilaginibacter sp.]|uniref:site-specific integrase n=1 Tax=Mucilaginibacter sp. TaxID=1882438 RepID=UPI00263293BB|nr:site-specific integrase [Mucilaginibacter sp.]MDB4919864.1 Site-specific recombinase XerD [Mucilaginibacter sp.]